MRSSEALVIAYPSHPDLARIAPFILEKRPPEELYDLKNDPWQLKDLAQDPAYAETKARLKAQLEEYQRETGDPRIIGDMDIFKATRELVINAVSSGLHAPRTTCVAAFAANVCVNLRATSSVTTRSFW